MSKTHVQGFIYNFTSLRPRTQEDKMIASLGKALRPGRNCCVPKPL